MTTEINKIIHLFDDLDENTKRYLQTDLHLIQQVTAASDGETIYVGAPKAPLSDRLRAGEALSRVAATLMNHLTTGHTYRAVEEDIANMTPQQINQKIWDDRKNKALTDINTALARAGHDKSFGMSSLVRSAERLQQRVKDAYNRKSELSMEMAEDGVRDFVKECNAQ